MCLMGKFQWHQCLMLFVACRLQSFLLEVSHMELMTSLSRMHFPALMMLPRLSFTLLHYMDSDHKVIIDRDSGRSRGFEFVNFSSDECASSAMSAMDGQPLDGRNIRVSFATDRAGPPRGGGPGYRGGFGDAGRNDGY
ncbi:unnamed protein product [Ilex paraguariensis]|uniref:RRM domain-containing protein n=1 Tax=Ilex paraguariensis TaxID=185542 RepID=A0ABC8TGQ6_9AQUA